MSVVVHIPWYATVFRGDTFAEAVAEISEASMRQGALRHEVFRSADDRYKFLQVVEFATKLDWTRYWESPEFVSWRQRHSGWFQVPVVYYVAEVVTSGARPTAPPPEAEPVEVEA